MSTNPWIVRGAPPPAGPAVPLGRPVLSGPDRPQPGVVEPPDQALPVLTVSFSAAGPRWWWLGCHGGAGVSTVARAIPGGADSARSWPNPASPGVRHRVVLVARTHAHGLRCAQLAARQWAAGGLPRIDLLGLLLVADAPGRLPKPLRDLQRLVAGGLPRVWGLDYLEALRLGTAPDTTSSTQLARLARELHQITGGP